MAELRSDGVPRTPNPLTKPISNVVYKYTPRQFAKAMLERGGVRIRILQDFTNEEKFGRFVGDKNEGRTVSSMHFEQVDTVDTLSQNEQAFCSYHRVDIKYSVGCSVMGAKRRSEPLYVYCVSDRIDRSLAREFCGDDEPWIIMIPNLHEFYWAVTERLWDYAEPVGGSLCAWRA